LKGLCPSPLDDGGAAVYARPKPRTNFERGRSIAVRGQTVKFSPCLLIWM